MLHALCVNMGGPLWCDHFEAADLSVERRAWWSRSRRMCVWSISRGDREAEWIEKDYAFGED